MNKAKYFIIGAAALIIIAIAVFTIINVGKTQAYSTSQNTNTLGSTVNQNTGNGPVQEVTLSMKNYQYVTDPAVLKKGVPVRMTVDLKTVVGCATDVVIADFGVRKAARPGDNVIEFTPTKTGTIAIACSMNMFHGTFTVIDPVNPNAPAEVTASTQAATAGGSCGAAGGGCGCGRSA